MARFVTEGAGPTRRDGPIVGMKLIALIGLIVVGVILIIQIGQGDTDYLHAIALLLVAVAAIATAVDMARSRRSLN